MLKESRAKENNVYVNGKEMDGMLSERTLLITRSRGCHDRLRERTRYKIEDLVLVIDVLKWNKLVEFKFSSRQFRSLRTVGPWKRQEYICVQLWIK